MLTQSPQPSVVDELWSLTRDGRWHSRRALTRRSSFKTEAVNAGLVFLVKYGFAQASGQGEMRIRVIGGTASPSEVAKMLSALAMDDERRSIWT